MNTEVVKAKDALEELFERDLTELVESDGWNRFAKPACRACAGTGETRRRVTFGGKIAKLATGRNEKCPCGREKKFKKCCLAKGDGANYEVMPCPCVRRKVKLWREKHRAAWQGFQVAAAEAGA